jgi:hypothetical protein
MTYRLFALLIVCCTTAHAAPNLGQKLGEVDFREWKNGLVLKLPVCEKGKNIVVQEIKLLVDTRRVHVDRIKLLLHTGEQLDIVIDKDIKTDSKPSWVSIGENPGCISVLRIVEDDEATVPPPPTDVVMSVWGR